MTKTQIDFIAESLQPIIKDIAELQEILKDTPITYSENINPLEMWMSNILMNATIELYRIHNELYLAKKLAYDVSITRANNLF